MSMERLLVRQGTYYYRRRVPASAVARIGRTVIQFSLKTKSQKHALRLRSLADVTWDAQFHFTPGSSESGHPPLQRAQIEEAVRDYVAKGVARFTDNFVRHPPNQTQREEIVAETEQCLSWLRRYDEPPGAEMIGRTYEKVFGSLDPGALEQMAIGLTQRALVEYHSRKIGSLSGEFVEFHDPLFDPRRKKALTFGELAQQFIAKRSVEDTANGLRQKTKDKWAVRVELIKELVGSGTLGPVDISWHP